MNRRSSLALAVVLLVAPAAAAAASAPVGRPLAGVWQRLPAAPVAPDFDRRTSVWTGKELLVFGEVHPHPADMIGSFDVAAAYDPAAKAWHKLTPPRGRTSPLGRETGIWTGKELLVWGSDVAYEPSIDRWRPLRRSLPGGLVVWTGREAIGWGGGCCGDAFSDGAAYNPATDSFRKLARSPLAGSQHPIGAWTGRELIILVGDLDPDGKPWPPRLARAAAYDPAANRWRRIPPLPAAREGAIAVWDGRELLVVGGTAGRRGALARTGFAFDPRANRWRLLPSLESGRTGALAVWSGKRVFVWGGQTGRPGSAAFPRRGLAYDPKTNRWSTLPKAPLPGRLEPTAAWTGRSLIVWGGLATTADHWGPYRAAGAAFTPKS